MHPASNFQTCSQSYAPAEELQVHAFRHFQLAEDHKMNKCRTRLVDRTLGAGYGADRHEQLLFLPLSIREVQQCRQPFQT
jgi:hypothetical protein